MKEIIKMNFLSNQFVNEDSDKKQIVLHHTVSGPKIENVAEYWASNETRVATHFIIGTDGRIGQCFDLSKWAYHLGVKQVEFEKNKVPYINLDKMSIGIELCNWGGLTKKTDGYYNYYENKVKNIEIVEYKNKYRGYQYFEKYTNEQIESLKNLLLYIKEIYNNIPLKYNESIWNFDINSLKGVSGIFSHTSYRNDKSDCHPQEELLNMLQSL